MSKLSKFHSNAFLLLTLINFVSLLAIFYLYYIKPSSVDTVHVSRSPKPRQNRNAFVSVDTKLGTIVGRKEKFQNVEVATFLSIPFARPPTGELQFRPPVELSPWNGTKVNAFQWPKPCVQPDNKLRLKNDDFSEDCLYLNIWSPWINESPKRLRPVLVMIHTGAFIFGSASESTYDGRVLAVMADLVVVTFNYRLNFFGFYYSDQLVPNLGMLDQVAALKWIRENIDRFGGDPEQVTLVGQSSGALAVGMHITSPLSQSLFSQAILMSGSPLQTPVLSKPEEVRHFWNNYAIKLGCPVDGTNSNGTFECIRRVIAEDRNKLPTMSMVKQLSSDSLFVNLPVVIAGDFQPRSQLELLLASQSELKNRNFSLLFGYTDDEGSWIASMEDKQKFGPKSVPNLTLEEAEQLAKNLLSKIRSTNPLGINSTHLIEHYLRNRYQLQLHDPKNDAIILSRLVANALGDHYIKCPANLFANFLLESFENRVNVYQYYWTYKGNHRTSAFWNTFDQAWCGRWMGACHSFEMYALFGAPFLEPEVFNAEDRVVSRKVIQMIGYFLHHRKLFWPKFELSTAERKAAKLYYTVDSLVDQFNFGTDLNTEVCEGIWKEYLL